MYLTERGGEKSLIIFSGKLIILSAPDLISSVRKEAFHSSEGHMSKNQMTLIRIIKQIPSICHIVQIVVKKQFILFLSKTTVPLGISKSFHEQ